MYTFEDLKQIMKTLRAEDGCPWDRAQDHDTLKKHLVEECAEVLEAIDSGMLMTRKISARSWGMSCSRSCSTVRSRRSREILPWMMW